MPREPSSRFFAEEGLDVDIVTFEGGIYVIRNVVSGALDAGGGAGAATAVSIARKAGIKAFYSPAPRFASTMTARANVRSLQDLRGKKIGVQEVGGFAVRGRVWAQNEGLPREKVEYTINRMVQVGNIKPEERPRYEDYVAVPIVQDTLRGLPRVADYD